MFVYTLPAPFPLGSTTYHTYELVYIDLGPDTSAHWRSRLLYENKTQTETKQTFPGFDWVVFVFHDLYYLNYILYTVEF